MADIPSGGRYKPNRATYRAILKSELAANLCERAAKSVGGNGRSIRQYMYHDRQKARIYDKDERIKHARPHL